MNFAAIIALLLQILPIILNFIPKMGPQTMQKYATQLQQIRANMQAIDAALAAAGVASAAAPRAAVHEEDITK